MWRSQARHCLLRRLSWIGIYNNQTLNPICKSVAQVQISYQIVGKSLSSLEGQRPNPSTDQDPGKNSAVSVRKYQIGDNVPRKDKVDFLVKMLLDMGDNKEDVYGTLDAWVAWEQNFPIASLKTALLVLEREQQWHRIVQVIKWMLSKGQGCTMGTYGQLIRALDMDHRAEEAHKFWEKKIGTDLHSVPWQLCRSMIAIYFRNNMLERLVQLFKNLEAFDRKPPEKSIVKRVADAYEVLGLLEEKERVLDKYKDLFTEQRKGSNKKSKFSMKTEKKIRHRKGSPTSGSVIDPVEDKK